ncbi:MAG: hypothetical protein QM648_04420 [Solirubrobacterales bacterium]
MRGVLVRWRIDVAPLSGTFTLNVLRFSGTDLRVVADATPIVPGATAEGIMTSPELRIPVEAGDLIGVKAPSGSAFRIYQNTGAGTQLYMSPAPALGTTGTPLTLSTGLDFHQGADIEPDIDGDGFGDQTQDSCPTDASTQGACPRPKISGFRFAPKKFRVNTKGKSLSVARSSGGSAIKLTLDRASQVTFVLTQRATGRKSGKKCKRITSKNRAGKKCTYNAAAWTILRDLPAGASTLPFSGRVKKKGKTRVLAAANYVVTAYPTSKLSGVGGETAKTSMTILR